MTPEEEKQMKKQKRAEKSRIRSKNEWIDQFLPEERGDDDFADLEDFVVVTEKGRQGLKFHEKETPCISTI